MNRQVLISFSLLICTVLQACSSRIEGGDHSFRIYKQSGVTIAETTGGAKFERELFDYEKILELEQDSTVTESLLFRPDKFTRGPDGYYYVIDYGNCRIAVFDESGIYQRSFGGEGEGPGTFRSPYFQDLHNGILHIRDFRLNRTTLMRLDGSLVEVLVRPRIADRAWRYRLENNRQLVLFIHIVFGEDFDWRQACALIGDADLDTVAYVSTEPVMFGVPWIVPGSSGRLHTSIHFSGFACMAYSPIQGILLSDGQSPRIYRYDNDGILIGLINLNLPYEPVPQAEKDRLISRNDRRVRSADNIHRSNRFKRYRHQLAIAEIKGFWKEMVVDDTGYIWLTVVENDFQYMEEATGTLCDLISPEGEYLGRSNLPGRFGDCVIVDGCVCACLSDIETGEYMPTVYRIRPAVEGLKYP